MFVLIGSILSVLGIGDVRKAKDWIIPASVIFTSMTIGIILSASGYGELDLFNKVSVFMLPLVLVVPFLAKGGIDNSDDAKL